MATSKQPTPLSNSTDRPHRGEVYLTIDPPEGLKPSTKRLAKAPEEGPSIPSQCTPSDEDIDGSDQDEPAINTHSTTSDINPKGVPVPEALSSLKGRGGGHKSPTPRGGCFVFCFISYPGKLTSSQYSRLIVRSRQGHDFSTFIPFFTFCFHFPQREQVSITQGLVVRSQGKAHDFLTFIPFLLLSYSPPRGGQFQYSRTSCKDHRQGP